MKKDEQGSGGAGSELEFYRSILESIPFYVFVKDREFRYTYVNDRSARLYGKPREDILGRVDSESIEDEEEAAGYREADTEVLETGEEQWVWRESYTGKGREKRGLTTAKAPLVDQFGETVGVVALAKDLNDFLGGDITTSFAEMSRQFAHALKNKLSAIQNNLRIFHRLLEGDDNALAAFKHVRGIVDDLYNLVEMMHRSSDLSRSSLLEKVDLGNVLRAIKRDSRDKRVEFDWPDDRCRITGDEIHLRAAVEELIENATRQISPSGRVVVCLRSDFDEGYYKIDVSDTGGGFGDSLRDKVFNLGMTTRKGGTGIGLYYVKEVGRLHKGGVELVDKPGFGATVRVRLPMPRVRGVSRGAR